MAKEYACKAIALNEDYVDPYVFLGILAYNEKRWADVVKWMRAAQTCSPPVELFFDYVPYLTYVPYDYMMIAYYHLGYVTEALACANKCLEYRPNDTRYLFNKELFEEAVVSE